MLIENHTAVFFDSRDELSVYECPALSWPTGKTRVLAQAGQEYLRRHYTVSRMTARPHSDVPDRPEEAYRQEKIPTGRPHLAPDAPVPPQNTDSAAGVKYKMEAA